MTAETQRRILLSLLASSHAKGSSALHCLVRTSGEMQYMLTKLSAIRTPDTANVHHLCLESVTSHGMNESMDATDAPKPNSTSHEGSAPHRSVLSDVNRNHEVHFRFRRSKSACLHLTFS